MDYIFIGGPGRSGTSFVANRLGTHPAIATFKDVELKVFCEIDGFFDVYQELVRNYTPNRAESIVNRFNNMSRRLVAGDYGQLKLEEFFLSTINQFIGKVTIQGLGRRLKAKELYAYIREFIESIAAECVKFNKKEDQALYFLEKTPHNLLKIDFISKIIPDGLFIHIMRDPRSIANSLLKMNWGPSQVESACRWISDYCDEWEDVKQKISGSDIQYQEFFIEDITNNYEQYSKTMLNYLDLPEGDDPIFLGSNIEVLNSWTKTVEAEQLTKIKTLDDLAVSLGYKADEIGVREK